MLKIREDQYQSFALEGQQLFAERLYQFLCERFPDAQQEPHESMLEIITEQMKKANSYGLTTERQVARYVVTAWLLGREFDQEFPQVQTLLTTPDVPAEDKSELLAQGTVELLSFYEQGAVQ